MAVQMETVNFYIVASYKVFFLIFGTIGNLLFIHLNFKRKQLQTRTSALQCFQCFFHLFCQLGTIFDGVITIGNQLNRIECFKRISFYIFFQAAQGIIMVIIVLDILIFVKFPSFYRNISLSKYIFITGFPVFSYSVSITIYGFLTTNEDLIQVCTPAYAFGIEASIIYKYLNILLSVIVLIIYIILIQTFHQRRQINNLNSLKTIKRLQFSVAIFIFTWFFSQIFSLIMLQTSEYTEWKKVLFVHINLFIALSYSNTFYATMWRSKEYREQFYTAWWPKRLTTSTAVTTLHASSHNV